MSKVAREITFVNHEYKGYAHEITNTEIKLYQQKKRNEMNGSTENARSVHIVKDENVIIAICDFCSNVFSRENAAFVCENKNCSMIFCNNCYPHEYLIPECVACKKCYCYFCEGRRLDCEECGCMLCNKCYLSQNLNEKRGHKCTMKVNEDEFAKKIFNLAFDEEEDIKLIEEMCKEHVEELNTHIDDKNNKTDETFVEGYQDDLCIYSDSEFDDDDSSVDIMDSGYSADKDVVDSDILSNDSDTVSYMTQE